MMSKGFSAYPAFRDSGVEWLGEIPSHWKATRFKHLLAEPLVYGSNESAELNDPTLPRYIRITDIDKNGHLRGDTFKSISEEAGTSYLLQDGDILLARSGATVGKPFLYSWKHGRAAHAGYLIRARSNRSRVCPEYVYFYLQSGAYKSWIAAIAIQATIQNVSAEKYANLVLSIPPLDEQAAIVKYLTHVDRKIDHFIRAKRRMIELLEEERQTLTSQAMYEWRDRSSEF